ncbi:hypothetical protein F2P81_022223 [Scophthalmus maximus]|uniref:Uncharacterized protein n=1 Tax=Scophthalmus maximus TaxID=52904 RepID=A0A6A4S1Y7_SCOMX|nr:hypothetical protein F2P81_022223 [Scophthalmus maximus]
MRDRSRCQRSCSITGSVPVSDRCQADIPYAKIRGVVIVLARKEVGSSEQGDGSRPPHDPGGNTCKGSETFFVKKVYATKLPPGRAKQRSDREERGSSLAQLALASPLACDSLSREELRVGRSSRRSGSYCCTVAEARSLERKLQRPILAKSRTLPSIPQSPTVSRVHHSDLIGGSPPRRRNPSTGSSQAKACTLPPAGELWRLEDDMEGEDEPEHGGCTEARPRSQSPFSHFRARAAYLRKSVSADDHLDMGLDYGSGNAAEGKPTRGTKGKLKRKFLGVILIFQQQLCVCGAFAAVVQQHQQQRCECPRRRV